MASKLQLPEIAHPRADRCLGVSSEGADLSVRPPNTILHDGLDSTELGKKPSFVHVFVECLAVEAHRAALPRGIILSLTPVARKTLALQDAERGFMPSS